MRPPKIRFHPRETGGSEEVREGLPSPRKRNCRQTMDEGLPALPEMSEGREWVVALVKSR